MEVKNGILYSETEDNCFYYIDFTRCEYDKLLNITIPPNINGFIYSKTPKGIQQVGLLNKFIETFFDSININTRNQINRKKIKIIFEMNDEKGLKNRIPHLKDDLMKEWDKTRIFNNKNKLGFINIKTNCLVSLIDLKPIDANNPDKLLIFILLLKKYNRISEYDNYLEKLKLLNLEKNSLVEIVVTYLDSFKTFENINNLAIKRLWIYFITKLLPSMLNILEKEIEPELIHELKSHILLYLDLINKINLHSSDQRLNKLRDNLSIINSNLDDKIPIDFELDEIKFLINQIVDNTKTNISVLDKFNFIFGGGTWGDILDIKINENNSLIEFIISKKDKNAFKHYNEIYLKSDNNLSLTPFIEKGSIDSGSNIGVIKTSNEKVISQNNLFIILKNIDGLCWIGTEKINDVINNIHETQINNNLKISEYVQIAKNYYEDNNYPKMIENNLLAYNKDRDYPNIIYYLSFSYFLMNKRDYIIKAKEILIENKNKLKIKELSLLALIKVLDKDYNGVLEIFDKCKNNLEKIPIEIRVDVLNAYMTSSYNITKVSKNNKLKEVSQIINAFINKEIDLNSKSGEFQVFTAAENVPIMKFELNSLIYLPSVRFIMGIFLLDESLRDNDKNTILLSLKLIVNSLPNALANYSVENNIYDSFELIVKLLEDNSIVSSNKSLLITLIETYLEHIDDAIINKIRIGGIELKKDFSQEDVIKLNEINRKLYMLLIGLKLQ